MLERFFPNEYVNSIYDINYDSLYERGSRYLIFDIDNTLAVFDEPHPTEKAASFLMYLLKKGFKICLVSNNKKSRVEAFNRCLKLPAVPRAGKPGKKGITKAMKLIGGEPDKTVFIGDQFFTDCWCGNRCGMYTILTKPIALRDEWTVRLKRFPEKFVMKAYLAQKGKERAKGG